MSLESARVYNKALTKLVQNRKGRYQYLYQIERLKEYKTRGQAQTRAKTKLRLEYRKEFYTIYYSLKAENDSL